VQDFGVECFADGYHFAEDFEGFFGGLKLVFVGHVFVASH
jgi:hypothetical protein